MNDCVQIDKKDLRLLLERKRDSIVHSPSLKQIVADLIALLSIGYSCVQWFDAGNVMHGLLFALVVLAGVFWFFVTASAIISGMKNKYSHEQLFDDIKGISRNEHPFNLMVIQHPQNRKILTVYDRRWDMWLLPYKKASSSEEGSRSDKRETDLVQEYLQVTFGIPEDSECSLRLRQYTHKYSVSDKVDKVYYHRFFRIMTDKLPDTEEFEINGNKCRWWNISDLEVDPKTQKNNAEIIAAVKNEVL